MDSDSTKRLSCQYCNGSLDPRYHFCVHCAMPYRLPDPKIYDPEPSYVPNLNERLAQECSSSWNLFFIMATGLITLGTIGFLLGKETLWISIALQEAFILTVVVYYLLRNWKEVAFLFRGVQVNIVLFASIPLLALMLGVNKVYHDFIAALLHLDTAHSWLNNMKDNLPVSLLIIMICIFPAIFEEIGFRGIVQQRLVRVGGIRIGFILTSILFMSLHFNIISAPYLFGLSLFFCWVRDKTCSIYPTMLLHFTHNFVVLFFL